MLKSQTGVKWSGMKDGVMKIADILIGMVVRIGIQMNITKFPGNENDYRNWAVGVAETVNNV